MNLSMKPEQSHRYGKQTYGYQGISRGGINWETGIDINTTIYKIVNKNFIAQRALLKYVYMYNRFTLHLKLTQHCKSPILQINFFLKVGTHLTCNRSSSKTNC